MTRRCIHCLAPVTPPAEVCESCVCLLDDLGEYDDDYEPPPSPVPPPQPRPPGRFQPTVEDDRQYRDLLARRSFEPFDQVRPKQLPSHATNRWGKAIASLKRSRRDPDIPKQ
jgi:hypothetical protein